MRKNRPVVTSKLNEWYYWLINHVPKTIKDGASRAFKTFKDKIMGFYNRVTGNRNQHEIEVLGALGSRFLEDRASLNHLIQQSLSKLLVELTEAIGLTEDLRWM